MNLRNGLSVLWRRSPDQGQGMYLLSLAVLALGLINLGFVLIAYISARLDFPAYDTWDFLIWWSNADSLPALIWRQYEHHRLVIVNLLMLLDQTVLFGHYELLFAVTIAAVLGVTFYLFLFQLAGPLTDRALLRGQLALALTVVFAVTNQEGFMHPYRSWTPLTLAVAAVSLTVLARALVEPKHSTAIRYLTGACLAAVVANVTGAPGILIWPTFLCVLILARAPWWAWLVVGLSGLAFLSVFFWGYQDFTSAGARGGLENLWHPFRLSLSLMARFGAPFGQALFVAPAAQFAGAFSLLVGGATVAGVAFVLISAMVRKTDSVAELSLLGLMIFAVGHICAATIKHTPLYPQPWTHYEKSSDFMAAMVAWACLWSLMALRLQGGRRPWLRVLFLGVVAGQLLLLLPMQVHGGFAMSRLHQEARVGVLSFLAGVQENTTHQHLLSPTMADEWTSGLKAFMRARELTPLDKPLYRQVDTVRADLRDDALPACDGEVSGTAPVQLGLRLWGAWAELGNGGAGILVADTGGRVIGIGEPFTMPKLGSVVDVPGLPSENAWLAYAGLPESAPYRIFGVDADGRAVCRFQ